MSRAQLTSTVEQSSGGVVAPFLAGKNKIINGDFNIWQRGTTFNAIASGGYAADRWLNVNDGNGTSNITQQTFTAGTAPVAGYESAYFLRQTVATSGTTTYFQVAQKIEDVRQFAGQTVTLSFWAKTDSARAGLSYYEQNFGSGGSSTNYITTSNFSFTTSWARYTATVSIPSISGKTIGTGSYFIFYIRGAGTSVGGYIDIWGVQLEAGSVATPFTLSLIHI